MTRKPFASPARPKRGLCAPHASSGRAAKNAKPMPDSKIDFSDVPESTGEELRRARRVGRPRTGQETVKHSSDSLVLQYIAPRYTFGFTSEHFECSKAVAIIVHHRRHSGGEKL
jgi:hypothetical protein